VPDKNNQDEPKKSVNKPDKHADKTQNKDTNINRNNKELGRHRKKNKNKEKSINEMGGKSQRVNGREDDSKHGARKQDNRRRQRKQEDNKRKDDRVQKARDEEARQKKVEELRDRRRAVQKYLDIANNSDNPLGEINWGDKNLKAKDRRKLRQILESRGFSDKEIYKEEKKDLNNRIKQNKKDNTKQRTAMAGEALGMAGTGGLAAIVALPSMIFRALRIRKNKKDTEQTKKSVRRRRIMMVLPTILIALGLSLAGWLLLLAGGQFVGTMLSHPEAIRELYDAGVLGNALYMGNVTEDVVIDGEVVVEGKPNAQPGCFVYNGVWYCGGCLSTGSVEASSNTEGVGGSGEVTGDLREPMDSPYQITSNYGSRWGRLHAGIDLVGKGGDLAVYAADGGEVSFARDECAPGSGYYPNNDPICGGWGNYVEIKHEGQDYVKTLYAHFDYVDVKTGDKVDKGQKIGTMGHTGNSTGAHLHFEVYEGDTYGTQVDPRKYIPTFPASGQSK